MHLLTSRTNAERGTARALGLGRPGEGKPETNEAGMSLKINDMLKYHPDQGFGRRGVGEFRREGCWPNKPKRLNVSCSNQIEGVRTKQTQSSYLPWNLSITQKIGPFFSKFECGTSSLYQGFRSLKSFDASP